MEMPVTSLTPEQQARIPEFLQKWSAIGSSTQPADRSRAAAAIEQIYRRAKIKRPAVIWLTCPLSARLSAIACSTLLGSDFVMASRADFGVDAAVAKQVLSHVESTMLSTEAHRAHSEVTWAVDYAVRVPARSEADLQWENFRHSEDLRYGFHFTIDTDWSAAETSKLHSIVQAAVGSAVDFATRSVVDATMKSSHRPWIWNASDKQERRRDGSACYPGFCALLDYCNQVLGIPMDRSFLDLSESCSHYWLLRDACFVAERPSAINRDARGRLHCETGPSIRFQSGWGLWHWHGVRIDRDTIERPEKLSVSRVEEERNAERRRVMIERYGQARYMIDSGAKLVHEDARGRLWRHATRWGEHTMVEVRNATPEPDGSVKTYFLRVPPGMRSASEAVAWTFGLTEETYQPRVET
jgi:hypothetical protein